MILFFLNPFLKERILKKKNFNLDFFYTINPEKKSVLGLQKSTFKIKKQYLEYSSEK